MRMKSKLFHVTPKALMTIPVSPPTARQSPRCCVQALLRGSWGPALQTASRHLSLWTYSSSHLPDQIQLALIQQDPSHFLLQEAQAGLVLLSRAFIEHCKSTLTYHINTNNPMVRNFSSNRKRHFGIEDCSIVVIVLWCLRTWIISSSGPWKCSVKVWWAELTQPRLAPYPPPSLNNQFFTEILRGETPAVTFNLLRKINFSVIKRIICRMKWPTKF